MQRELHQAILGGLVDGADCKALRRRLEKGRNRRHFVCGRIEEIDAGAVNRSRCLPVGRVWRAVRWAPSNISNRGSSHLRQAFF